MTTDTRTAAARLWRGCAVHLRASAAGARLTALLLYALTLVTIGMEIGGAVASR